MNRKLRIMMIGLGACLLDSVTHTGLVFPSKASGMETGTKEKSIIENLGKLQSDYDKFKNMKDVDNLAKTKESIVKEIDSLMKSGYLPLRSDQGSDAKKVREKVKEVLKAIGEIDYLNNVVEKYYSSGTQKTDKLISTEKLVTIGQPKTADKEALISSPSAKIESGGTININSNDITIDYLLNNPPRDDKKIATFAKQAVEQALEKMEIKGDIKLSPDQGWNSVAFVVSSNGEDKYVVKFAKGKDEAEILQNLKKTVDNLNNPNISDSLALPFSFFNVQLNGIDVSNYTIQTMNYFKNEAEFETILKRLCDGEWWVEVNNDWKNVKFNQDTDLKLISYFGQSLGRLQRGGKERDEKVSNKTLVHGDLFTQHIRVSGYDLENNKINPSSMTPKFSFIDLPTMKYVDDSNCNLLLVDPMFLSSVMLFEKGRKNVRQGLLNIFNNFYIGYVNEFSDATLDKLAELLLTSDSAYKAFERAASYESKIGKAMKTREYKNKFQEINLTDQQQINLEKQLSNLHRLTFLMAYYKKKGDNNKLEQIQQEQKQWDMDIFQMAKK